MGFSGVSRKDFEVPHRSPAELPIRDARVVILGGTGGIGRALAAEIAAGGGKVTIVDRTRQYTFYWRRQQTEGWFQPKPRAALSSTTAHFDRHLIFDSQESLVRSGLLDVRVTKSDGATGALRLDQDE